MQYTTRPAEARPDRHVWRERKKRRLAEDKSRFFCAACFTECTNITLREPCHGQREGLLSGSSEVRAVASGGPPGAGEMSPSASAAAVVYPGRLAVRHGT